MTRILFLTDTHLGGGAEGFCQQPRAYARTRELLFRVGVWAAENDISLILHGGDIVDEGTPEQLSAAAEILGNIPVTTNIILGNHDLSTPAAAGLWASLAPSFFPFGLSAFAVHLPSVAIYGFTHHWDRTHPPHYWDQHNSAQTPVLSAAEEQAFISFLKQTEQPVIAAFHAPLNGVPPEQSGQAAEIHPPDPDLARWFVALGEQYPHFKLVLGGHNHVTTRRDYGSLVTTTTAAFSEMPFDARLISIDKRSIRVETISFASVFNLTENYDDEHSWVQGTERERTFSISV